MMCGGWRGLIFIGSCVSFHVGLGVGLGVGWWFRWLRVVVVGCRTFLDRSSLGLGEGFPCWFVGHIGW
jgi:hypothetical protein